MQRRRPWKAGLLALLFALTAGCGHRPDAATALENHFYDLLSRQRKVCHVDQAGLAFTLWAHTVKGRTLHGIIFKQQGKAGNYNLVLHAREASLRIDSQGILVLDVRDGVVLDNSVESHFDQRVLQMPISLTPQDS